MNIPERMLGRLLFSLPLVVFGAFHFMAGDKMAGAVPAWVPGGVIWVYITGLAMIAAPIAILTGKKAKLAAQLTALLMLTYALTVQLPGAMAGDQMSTASFLKDIMLCGGALLMAHLSDD
ncbi:MAG: hypothetical protein RLZZ273_1397 [Bacteroidota bacterium]|jgi:uncharacterized membrane protein YphA (DoxX/SURF4 family)